MERGAKASTPDEVDFSDRPLFRNRDFLIPYLAETQSIAGDQIGRVALSILVFDRTSSAAWTALTYALTYLPAILGGVVLGTAGDRFPRVTVMVLADLARAVIFLVVAIRGMPLWAVVSLVSVAFFLAPGFTAALVSRLAATLTPERFRTASGIRMISSQSAQVAGFAIGGVVVAAVRPRSALLIDAATFALSALAIGVAFGVSLRRNPSADGRRPGRAEAKAAAPRLFTDPVLRPLILMTGLAAFFVVPEGLAVPVAHHLGASNQVTGLLLAAGPLGSAVGAAVLIKFVPPRRGMGVARVMSVVCGVPLVATAALSAWPLVLACWALSGAFWAYQVDVATTLVHAVDDSTRTQTIARASAFLLGAQGAGLLLFGAIGSWLGAGASVTVAGATGAVIALGLATSGLRESRGSTGRTAGTPSARL